MKRDYLVGYLKGYLEGLDILHDISDNEVYIKNEKNFYYSYHEFPGDMKIIVKENLEFDWLTRFDDNVVFESESDHGVISFGYLMVLKGKNIVFNFPNVYIPLIEELPDNFKFGPKFKSLCLRDGEIKYTRNDLEIINNRKEMLSLL